MATDRGEAFERFSRAVDGPMIVLALAMIPLIIVLLVVNLSPSVDRALLAIDYLIWPPSPSSASSSCTWHRTDGGSSRPTSPTW